MSSALLVSASPCALRASAPSLGASCQWGSLVSIGRSLAVQNQVPADRKAFLRAAFESMAKDPKFAADMKKRKLEATFTSADEIQKVVTESLAMSPEIIARTNKILFGGSS